MTSDPLLADLEALPPDEWRDMTTAQWRAAVQRTPRYTKPEPPEDSEMIDEMESAKRVGDLTRAAVMLGFAVASRERDRRRGEEPEITEQDITDLTNQVIGTVEGL
jgi:hypothetical protein